jgi:hypothetical protein
MASDNPWADEEDERMVDYFWNQKGDLDRWTEFQERRPHLPASLVRAWDDYKHAEAVLDAIVSKLVDRYRD